MFVSKTLFVAIVLLLTACLISSFKQGFIVKKIFNSRRTQLFGNGKPVEVKFEPSGKVVMAEQGDNIGDVAKKAGVNIPFNCKQGRCTSCEVRLNGRVTAKICQGALIPTGPTKSLIVAVVNTKPLK